MSTRAGDADADANTEVDGSARDGLRVPTVRAASELACKLAVAMPEAALLDRRMCGCDSAALVLRVRADVDMLAAALSDSALVL